MTREFTFGYRAYDSKVFNQYLYPSLKNLKEDFDVICEPPLGPISANYNKMLDRCTTPYLIFIHEDMGFSPDLFQVLKATMAVDPDFGNIWIIYNYIGKYCSARKELDLVSNSRRH